MQYFRPLTVRAFSTSRSDGSSLTDSSGLVIFSDADKDKLNILKYSKGKSGIYLWTNKLNGKKYVGSSVDNKLNGKKYVGSSVDNNFKITNTINRIITNM